MKTEYDIYEHRKDLIEKLNKEGIGSRDWGIYSARYVEVEKALGNLGNQRADFVDDLKELRKASDGIEKLNLNESDSYKAIFESGKKKEILLVN